MFSWSNVTGGGRRADLEVSESTWPADQMMIIDEYDIEQEPAHPEAPSEI